MVKTNITKAATRRKERARYVHVYQCPFCGEMPIAEPWHGGSPSKVLIQCVYERCPANPQVSGESHIKAERGWNERPSDAKPTRWLRIKVERYNWTADGAA